MKIVLASVLLLTGCSTIGDLEVLNDLGSTGRMVGTVSRTIDSSCKVITGRSCEDTRFDTPSINRSLGSLKQLPYVWNTKSVPHILQQMQN